MANRTIDDIREATKTEVITLLQRHKQCALIRGTGYGKTWQSTEIASYYDKALFLYPADIIRNTAEDVMGKIKKKEIVPEEIEVVDEEVQHIIESKIAENVTFMSYAKFSRLKESDILDLAESYDLIIADECHRLGGKKTKINYMLLIDVIKSENLNTHRLITTATPFRTNDDFDVVAEFAGGITPFAFTIKDMINNKFMKAPKYACSLYSDHFLGTKVDRGFMDSLKLAYSKIFNPPEKIRYTNNKYLTPEQLDSMTFICFYSNSKTLHRMKRKVSSWFKKAHPDHSINNIIVSSEKKEYRKNVNRLLKLKHKHQQIILVHAIDMLNLGYHINDITGVCLFRNTQSNIIYAQQLGRVYSTNMSEGNRIVYDFVDNISRRAVYDSDFQDSYIGRIGNIDFNVIDELKSKRDSGEITIEEYNNAVTDYLQTIERVVPEDEDIHIDNTSEESEDNEEDTGEDIISVGSSNRNLFAYDMDEEYVEVKEQIKKLLIEPEAILIRQTLVEFFRRWCITNNIEFPLSQTELKLLYELNWSDFIKDLKVIISKYGDQLLGVNNRYDTTLYKYFIAMDEDKNTILHLDLFAKHIGQTTVPRIMNLLEVAA